MDIDIKFDFDKIRAAEAANDPAKAAESMGSNTLMTAYFLLVQWLNNVLESSNIQTKQLNANAHSQQKLNNEIAQRQLQDVPTGLSVAKTIVVRHASGPKGIRKWIKDHPQYDVKKYWYITMNRFHTAWRVRVTAHGTLQIQAVQAHNQQVAGFRDFLEGQLFQLQQLSQEGGTLINSQTQKAFQTVDEAAALIKMIEALIFKVQMRKKPRTAS